jgi:hypothetical protein
VKLSGLVRTPTSCGFVLYKSRKSMNRAAPMERFQYEVLGWVELSEQQAIGASAWYRGAGWYMNGRDTSGEITSCRLVAPASTSRAEGALGALNVCGSEGWDVASYVHDPPQPAALGFTTEVLLGKIFGGEVSPPGACFLLKRRFTD